VQAEALPPVDPRYGALAIIGMVSSVHRWYDPKRDKPPEAIADEFARLLGLKPSPAAGEGRVRALKTSLTPSGPQAL